MRPVIHSANSKPPPARQDETGAEAVSARLSLSEKLQQKEPSICRSPTLNKDDVEKTLYAALKSFNRNALRREITRIPFGEKDAFLLPLGSSEENFQGLFFYPRSPKLRNWDNGIAIAGFLLAGQLWHPRYTTGDCSLEAAETSKSIVVVSQFASRNRSSG